MSVVTEQESPEETPSRKLTRAEAYQYLLVTLDRLDRDVSVLTQGAGPNGELTTLSAARKGLLDAQRELIAAQHHSLNIAT